MKVCIYSPYIPKHFGGGEKYLLEVAQTLANRAEVQIVSNQTPAKSREAYQKFLGRKLNPYIKFVKSPLGTDASFWEKLWWTKQFDVMYYATDGSLFLSLAKRNILHIQIPFTSGISLSNRLKLLNWHVKNTNSEFTRKVIEKNWQIEVDEVHLPVQVDLDFLEKSRQKITQKELVVLHVGRFFRHLHSKRQDALVEMWQKLNKKSPQLAKKWQLVLVGSVEDQDYLAEIKKKAKGLNIKILNQVSRAQLEKWYQKASIYWHATGFEADEMVEPQKMEHFGISLVEAMSYGCVPVVINKGGMKEIVKGRGLKDLLWNSLDQGADKTIEMMSDLQLRRKKADLAIKRVSNFSQRKFDQTLWKMVGNGLIKE